MNLPKHFISCDWGTTNFRLKVVETDSLNILHEHSTAQGIKAHFEAFQRQGRLDQFTFFEEYLSHQIAHLPKEFQELLIIASGMITANIGMSDLPYADFPIQGNGTSLLVQEEKLSSGPRVFFISGVKGGAGMVRGEETQAIGLADQMGLHSKSILILPGTHSKHMTYEHGSFVDLKNFMTGELFEVLATKSILGQSVLKSSWSEVRKPAFLKGVSQGVDESLTGSLLTIRANQVLHQSDPKDNYYYLSGLLIGNELGYLRDSIKTIYLAAPESLRILYQLALHQLVKKERVSCFTPHEVEHALLSGQKKIIRHYDQ